MLNHLQIVQLPCLKSWQIQTQPRSLGMAPPIRRRSSRALVAQSTSKHKVQAAFRRVYAIFLVFTVILHFLLYMTPAETAEHAGNDV